MPAPSALDYLNAPDVPSAIDYLNVRDEKPAALDYLNSTDTERGQPALASSGTAATSPAQDDRAKQWKDYFTGASKVKPSATPEETNAFLNEAGLGAIRDATSPASLSKLGADYSGSGPLNRAVKASEMAPQEALSAMADSPLTGVLPRPSGTSTAAGATRAVESTVEGLASPMNIALLGALPGAPSILQKGASLFFAGQMASNIPDRIAAARQATTPADKAEAYTGAAIDGLFSILAFAHANGRSNGVPDLRKSGSTQEQIDHAIKQVPKPTPNGEMPDEILDGAVSSMSAIESALQYDPENKSLTKLSETLQGQLSDIPKDRIEESQARVAKRTEQPADATESKTANPSATPEAPAEQSPSESQPREQQSQASAPVVDASDQTSKAQSKLQAPTPDAAAIESNDGASDKLPDEVHSAIHENLYSSGAPLTAEQVRIESEARAKQESAEAKLSVDPEPTPEIPTDSSEGDHSPLKATSTKNAVMEAERTARNAAPIIKEAKQTNADTFAQAESAIEKNPDHARNIVTGLLDGTKKEVSATDEAGLLYEKVRLMNARDAEASRVLDEAASPGEREEARIRWAQHEASLNDLDHATAASGRIWGRLGQFRQRLLRSDYTFEAMEQRARIAKGGALTAEESAKIKEQSARITELENKLEANSAKAAEADRLVGIEAAFDAFKKESESQAGKATNIPPRVVALAESIVSRLDKSADAARARIRARLKNANALLDPTVIYDIAVIGAAKLGHASLDFAKWSTEMSGDLGEWVKPHLEEAWKQTNALWEKEEKRLSIRGRQEIKQVREKNADSATRQQTIVEAMRARVADGDKLTDMRRFVQSLAREAVASGVKDRDAMVDTVHTQVAKILPGVSRDGVSDAISGYGDFRPLSTAAVDVTLRDLKGQLQQASKIRDMQAKVAPAKTGIERRTPSDEERRLIREVNELKKKGGFAVTDPATQLKTAMEAMKTRLRNETRDLEHAVATGERITAKRGTPQYDAEAKALLDQRNAKRAEYDAAFPKEPLTEAQQVERAGKALDASIAALEGDLRNGRLYPDKTSRRLTSPELEAKRVRLEALRAERDTLRDADTTTKEQAKEDALVKRIIALREKVLNDDAETRAVESTVDTQRVAELKAERDGLSEQIESNRKAKNPPKTEEQKRVADLDKRIAEAEAKIAAGDTTTQTGRPTVDTEAVAERRAELDELNDQLDEMRKGRKKTAEEIALQAFKTRALSRLADLKDRIARKDFEPKPRRPIAKDAEATKLETEVARVKLEFDRARVADRLEKRTGAEKFLDGLAKWRRAFVLSGVKTLAKLTSAAGEIIAIAPLEEAAGGLISKALPGIADQAPRHGGFSLRAEREAIVGTWRNLLRDAASEFKTGHMDIDLLYGRPDIFPKELKDYIAHVHGALKSPARRNEFIRSFEKRVDHALRNGVDVSDPLVQTKLSLEAYKNANSSVFRDDNRVVTVYNGMLRGLAQVNKETGRPSMRGKLGETFLKVTLPVVRIPTNVLARTFEYSFGTGLGAARIARAVFQEGLRNLNPSEADAIVRNIKRGSLGATMMAIGYFNADKIGGYYQPGKKRDENDVHFGSVRVFGHDVPSYLVHNPLLEQLQIGATIRRVADSKLRTRDKDKQGLFAGAVASAVGVLEESPFLNEAGLITKLTHPSERKHVLADFVKMAIPIGIQQAATALDKDAKGNTVKRQRDSTVDEIKGAIPGVRNTVPKAH